MSNHLRILISLITVLLMLAPNGTGIAQQAEEGPIYIVQPGDSLWDIALRFRVSLNELLKINGISNPDQITVGTRLVIPGLEGIQGTITSRTVPFGATLSSLSRHYQLSIETLTRLNHLTSPAELYAGASLVLLEENAQLNATKRMMILPGQSLLELAVTHNVNPWELVLANHLAGTWSAIPGDVLHHQTQDALPSESEEPSALPELITNVKLQPSPFVQGKTSVIQISGAEGLTLKGQINGREFLIFADEAGLYTGLQGIHAMLEPGLYPVVISATLPIQAPYHAAPFVFAQAVSIISGNYRYDPVLKVSPETIDPAVTRPEDAIWTALASPVTPEKLWVGQFQSPAPEPFKNCWPSVFGSRRSYNGSAYIYFHTGLDFCGGVGTEIHAPASGIVVFAGPLTVRGNATMINHGWGVYTGYLHQSEILVKVGDKVEAGQLIGRVGGTGRVTGPHLHWEVWVGGVQVDPLDWLQKTFP